MLPDTEGAQELGLCGVFLSRREGHHGDLALMRLSPGGDILASGSGDKTVRLWDTTSAQCPGTLQGQVNAVL